MRPPAGQVVLITGATAGLGRHLARTLMAEGMTVIAHGRDQGRLDTLDDEISETPAAGGNGRLVTVLADLADLASVERLAAAVAQRTDRLHVLVNNAGVGFGAPGAGRELSADGYELRFAVNYLAGYLLTRRLVPLLVASAPARVVNVASLGQVALDFDDLMGEQAYDGVTAYRRSKLAQIMFGFDLADELRHQGVTVNSLHPATFMDTAMVRQAGHEPMSTVEEGAGATLRLITAPELDGVTGRFFDRRQESRARDQAYDPEARRRLRQVSDDLVGQALAGPSR